ncbi:MAG: NADH-quinone oxidoreductase subunit NuoN [Gammaproteobacteria bacterium]|nr:MAG: NADH-quinone oxidoreductase subunit NuoN [Gammaproteobacteria bacterium]
MNNIFADIQLAIPEIFVFSMACVILLLDRFTHERMPKASFLLTQLTLLVTFYLVTITVPEGGSAKAFNDMFVLDGMATLSKQAILSLTFVVLIYSYSYITERKMYRGEYFVLILNAVLGMIVLTSASHFLTIYIGLELLSLSLYTLVAMNRDSDLATEAAMKYFVLGALASGMLLYGMSMIYGATGSLDIETIRSAIQGMESDDAMLILGLVFIIVGVGFKLGVVPFHMWVPDIYQGAPTSVVLFLGTAPKVAAFAFIMRLLVDGFQGLAVSWSDMLTIIAVLSMATGNLLAIVQTNLKRMLAYSTISHMGYFLLGILSANPNGYSASLFYIIIYSFTSLAAFGLIIMMSRAGFEAEEISDYKGLNKRHPWFAFLVALVMFSMAGIPPTIGFFAKLSVIQALMDVEMYWLAVVAILFAVIGAYYYLRIVKTVYFDKPETNEPISARFGMQFVLSVNALALILIIPWIGIIMDVVSNAISAMG